MPGKINFMKLMLFRFLLFLHHEMRDSAKNNKEIERAKEKREVNRRSRERERESVCIERGGERGRERKIITVSIE